MEKVISIYTSLMWNGYTHKITECEILENDPHSTKIKVKFGELKKVIFRNQFRDPRRTHNADNHEVIGFRSWCASEDVEMIKDSHIRMIREELGVRLSCLTKLQSADIHHQKKE